MCTWPPYPKNKFMSFVAVSISAIFRRQIDYRLCGNHINQGLTVKQLQNHQPAKSLITIYNYDLR